MPLVYLDTSHLSQLEQLRTRRPEEYLAFLETWRSLHCELAISRTHFLELRRHNDPAIRRSRYEVLADLLPVRLDTVVDQRVPTWFRMLEKREALWALERKGIASIEGVTLNKAIIGFPTILSSREDVSGLQEWEGDDLGAVAHRFHSATSWSAQADATESGKRYRPNKIIPRSVKELVREIVSETLLQYRATGSLERAHRWRRRGRLVLTRAAMLIAAPVALPLAWLASRVFRKMTGMTDADVARGLSSEHLLARATARSWAADVLRDAGISGKEAKRISSELELEDCPSILLQHLVRQRFLNGTEEPLASDHYDLAHLSHAPYVDLLFTDKRMREFATQALRRKGGASERDDLARRIVSAADPTRVRTLLQERFSG